MNQSHVPVTTNQLCDHNVMIIIHSDFRPCLYYLYGMCDRSLWDDHEAQWTQWTYQVTFKRYSSPCLRFGRSFVGKTMSEITHLGMVHSTYKNAALGDSDWSTMFYPHELHLNTLSLSNYVINLNDVSKKRSSPAWWWLLWNNCAKGVQGAGFQSAVDLASAKGYFTSYTDISTSKVTLKDASSIRITARL